MNLAQGGYFGAMGVRLTDRTRLAMSWTASPDRAMWSLAPNQAAAQSGAMAVGLTTKLTAHWSAGVTFAALDEKNGLLGTTFDSAGLLSLGETHKSSSLAFTMSFDLGHGRGLLFDALLDRTSGAPQLTGGLISSISPLTARAYGVSFVQANAFRPGDDLTLSIRKPLRVISGAAQLAVTTVDSQGYSSTNLVSVGLRPSGDETDAGVSYATPLRNGAYLTTGLTFRADADNVAGVRDVVARLAFNKRF